MDIIACQLSVAVFHLYAQHLDKVELNVLNVHHRERSILGISNFSYDYPSLNILKDWNFKPFFRHLGSYFSYQNDSFNSEFFGVVGYNKELNIISVVFRGSQVISEYFYNNLNIAVKLSESTKKLVNIRDSKYIDGWHKLDFTGPIHAGYYNRIETCKKQIFDIIETFNVEKPNLIITGHSLGGASSCVFAGIIDINKFNSVFLCPFGAPMVSTSEYGKWLQQKNIICKNYVTEKDSVPSFPPFQLVGVDFLSDNPIIQKFEPFIEPIVLTSFTLSSINFLAAHDVRLYYKSLCKKLQISSNDFPLAKLSNDSQQMKNIFDDFC